MITKNRVIAERLLREFIRGSFGIISDGLMPGDEEVAAEEAKKLIDLKTSHLQEADQFISNNATALNDILDRLEGPSIDSSLTDLMNILTEAMNLDNKYSSKDNTDPNFATTFTCVAIADGNIHYIPYLAGVLFDIFGSRITSNTTLIREAGGAAASKIAEEVDRIAKLMIPLIFREDAAIAKKISDNPSLFDMNAKGDYTIPARNSQGVLSPSMPNRKAASSFRDTLKSSIEKNMMIKIDQNTTVLLEDAVAKINELDTDVARLIDVYKGLVEKQKELNTELSQYDIYSDEYAELSEKIDVLSTETTKTQDLYFKKQEQIKTLKDFDKQARAAILAKINDEQYIIGQIKAFAISDLKGTERIASQYPNLSKAGEVVTDAAKTKIGKYTISAALTAALTATLAAAATGLAAGGYTLYEMTPVQIKRVNATYSASQNKAIDTIAELFNDNDYSGSGYYEFATKLRGYKAVAASAGK